MKFCTLYAPGGSARRLSIRSLIIKKLIVLLLISTGFQVNATAYGQTFFISKNNAPLNSIFKEIEKQGYLFWYEEALLKDSKNVTIHVNGASISEVLALCFKDQPLTYTLADKVIVLQQKLAKVAGSPLADIRGKITDD